MHHHNSLPLFLIQTFSLTSIASALYGRFVKRLSKEFQDSLAQASDIASEALANIRTVRSFSKEDYETENYSGKHLFALSDVSAKIGETFVLARKRALGFGAFTGIITFFANVVIGFVLWYGGLSVIDGKEIKFVDYNL